MKYIAVLTCLLLTSIANTSFAVPSNDCAARSEKVKVTERDEFMKSCLAQVDTPANVKEAKQKHKSARCEQNAKNMHLQGADKGNYQADCINKNEAVVAANTLPKNAVDISPARAPDDKAKGKKSASHKDAAKKPAAKKQKEHKKNASKKEKQATRVAGASEPQ